MLSPLRSLLQGKRKLHFLHISKTGGTAIKQALKGCTSKRFEIELHGHDFRLPDVPAGEFAFFVVRDPVERFVSGFNSRLRQGKPRYNSPWSPEEALAFSRFATPNALAEAIYVEDLQVREFAQHAMSSISHIRGHMSHWIGDLSDKDLDRIVFIGAQPTLTKDFAELTNHLQLEDRPVLPDSDIQAHRNPSHLDRNLSGKAHAALLQWYEQDLRIYRRAKELSGRGLGTNRMA